MAFISFHLYIVYFESVYISIYNINVLFYCPLPKLPINFCSSIPDYRQSCRCAGLLKLAGSASVSNLESISQT